MKKKIFKLSIVMIMIPIIFLLSSCEEKSSESGSSNSQDIESKEDHTQYTDAKYFEFEDGVITGYSELGPKSVVIPKKINGIIVKAIGNEAFRKIELTSVIIPDTVTKIGVQAFAFNKLTSIIIPNSVTEIGIYAFGDNELTSLVISENITNTGKSAFVNNKLTTVVIPENVTEIGSSAFANNKLTSVVIPKNVTSIGGSAFEKNKLTTVVIPGSVRSIGNWAFSGNELTSLTIQNGVTEIGMFAFMNNQLTSVTIPDSVTKVEQGVFSKNNLIEVPSIIAKRDEEFKKEIAARETDKEKAKEKEVEEKRNERGGKWIVESNNYNVWQQFLAKGTYVLKVKHEGDSNCIVYGGTKENEKQKLIINEIGQGEFAGTLKVANDGMYIFSFEANGFSFEINPL